MGLKFEIQTPYKMQPVAFHMKDPNIRLFMTLT